MEIVLSPFVGTFEPGLGFYWATPKACLGSVDLSNPASWSGVKADVGARAGQLLCVVEDGTADDAFVRLSNENAVDARPDATMVDAWFAFTKFRPAGDTVADLLWDHLTRGADPAGLDACFPFTPQHDLQLPLWLAGQRIRDERFQLGASDISSKVVDVVKRVLRTCRTDTLGGRLRNQEGVDYTAHRKVMDWWCEKLAGSRNPAFKLAVFDAIRPADWPVAEGLIPHETQYNENFDTANGTTLGPQQSWSELGGGNFNISGNQVTCNVIACRARCDADFSGSDNYSQILVPTRAGNTEVCFRFSSSADTAYRYLQSSTLARFFRVAAGTQFQVGSNVSQVWPGAGYLQRGEVTGPNLTGLLNGSIVIGPVSDSNILSGTRAGFGASGATGVFYDDWQGGDLGGSTYNESISLAGAAGFSNGALINVPLSVNLPAVSTFTETPRNNVSSAAQLAGTANVQATARLIMSTSLSLASNAGFLASLQLLGGPQTFNETVALAAIAGLSQAAKMQLALAVQMAANAAILSTAKQVAGELVGLGASAGVIPQATAIFQEALALAVRAAFEAEGRTGSLYAPIAKLVWRLDPLPPVFRLDERPNVWRVDE